MSEPKAVAAKIVEVVPGVWHWSLEDERIGGFIGSAHAVRADGLGDVSAICLTCGSHQRSAWRLRRELGVGVHAPELVREVDEEPDVRYEDGDVLPGALEAFFTPGAGTTQHALLDRERCVLFTADLFVRPPGEELGFVPDEYLHDPAEARRSARRLLELDFDVLCTGHGVPLVDDPKGAIRALLERSA